MSPHRRGWRGSLALSETLSTFWLHPTEAALYQGGGRGPLCAEMGFLLSGTVPGGHSLVHWAERGRNPHSGLSLVSHLE